MLIRSLSLVLLAALASTSLNTSATTIRVGPKQEITTISGAAARAHDGDTVEIMAGDYYRDTAVWNQNNLTLRAVNGPVRINAEGASAQGKGIWVISGRDVVVEGIEFAGAKVADRNGAGIRLDGGSLTVRKCRFIKNQNGILTSNRDDIQLIIEDSEFAENGYGDGQSHNLYVGGIARLKVTGSYFHHAHIGHLLKSRAKLNYIAYNRLTDEVGGRASYELEFPTGGVAYVIGNIIEQSSTTDNNKIISYGAEGYKGASNTLYVIHNTLVDDRPTPGVFVEIKPGASVDVKAFNNLLVGDAKWSLPDNAVDKGNVQAKWEELAMPMRMDYRPRANAPWVNKAVPLPMQASNAEFKFDVSAEYAHPAHMSTLTRKAQTPGALQTVAR